MASAEAEGIKELMRAAFSGSDDQAAPTDFTSEAGLAKARESGAALSMLTGEPEGVTYTEVDAGGVAAMWVDAPNSDPSRVIQYVHGGGYVICSMHTHAKFTGHLAIATGCRVLSVDYGLAPERPHPAAVNDSVAAYTWLLGQGIDPAKIAIAGDSAGGGLTVATLLKIRDDGLAAPAGAVPLSPWVDLEGVGESMDTNAATDLLIQRSGLQLMATLFLDGASPIEPYAAPLYADLRGLPPIYLQAGGEEALLDDSTRLASKLGQAGVAVRLDVFPEMQHVFQLAAGNMPEADEALARIGTWIDGILG